MIKIMLVRGAGIRDIRIILQVSVTTVLKALKSTNWITSTLWTALVFFRQNTLCGVILAAKIRFLRRPQTRGPSP
jgi:hypothetical protein